MKRKTANQMFESTIHWILKRFLGEYVKDFNADSVQLRLMEGSNRNGGVGLRC